MVGITNSALHTKAAQVFQKRGQRTPGASGSKQALPGCVATLLSPRAVVGLSHLVKDFALRGLGNHWSQYCPGGKQQSEHPFNPEDAPGLKRFLL